MTTQLEPLFRNLLIALARDAQGLTKKIAELEESAAKAAQHPTKVNALRALIAERKRQRSRYHYLLSRNADASRYFFGTVNTQEISCEQILFAEKV